MESNINKEYSIKSFDVKNIVLIKHYTNKHGEDAEAPVGYFSTVDAAARRATDLMINSRLEGAEDMDEFIKRIVELREEITEKIMVECCKQC